MLGAALLFNMVAQYVSQIADYANQVFQYALSQVSRHQHSPFEPGAAARPTQNKLRRRSMIDHRTAPYAALLLRVAMGSLFVAHGLLKVLVFTIPGTVAYFQSIGYPGFFAYLVIAAEIGGGLLLIGGVYTRWVALALVPVMIGATLQHVPNGWLFSSPKGGWEFPALWTALLVVQALLGDGAHALVRGERGARIASARG